MKTNTFKIENRYDFNDNVVIVIEIEGNNITIIGKKWDFSKYSNKGINQSKAKEFIRKTFKGNEDLIMDMDMFLYDLGGSYYALKILKWINTKLNITKIKYSKKGDLYIRIYKRLRIALEEEKDYGKKFYMDNQLGKLIDKLIKEEME